MLTSKQIASLTAVYKIYKTKNKVERKAIFYAFKKATGADFGKKYYSIPIVRKIIDLIE